MKFLFLFLNQAICFQTPITHETRKGNRSSPKKNYAKVSPKSKIHTETNSKSRIQNFPDLKKWLLITGRYPPHRADIMAIYIAAFPHQKWCIVSNAGMETGLRGIGKGFTAKLKLLGVFFIYTCHYMGSGGW